MTMRRIAEDRVESAGFEEHLRSLVRNSPWWMTSLVFHLVLALILWNIAVEVRTTAASGRITSEIAQELLQPEIPPPPPPPEIDTTVDPIDPVPDPDDQPKSAETDDPDFGDAGVEGDLNSPLGGPGFHGVIGLTGGAAGCKPGGGGRGSGKGPTGGKAAQDAVELGLRWLAEHQDLDGDGKWDCDDYAKHDPPTTGATGPADRSTTWG
ncbi:MAG: hypothetical protein HC813_01250 [Planctomycetes bacterium]|nr:hypothetical protein [Planctomycetota bacterium]